ncbi:MAG: rhodanese-like domain-containing protein [Defluviitaleaceae bacterium]|nr:rhodanese-like domain-containing protein [Defluviitaleaceae bacterium]
MIKKIFLIIAIFVAIAIFAACTQNSNKITASEARRMMDENPHAIVLDVRTQQEFNEGHIANAVLIPLDMLKEQAPEKLPDKNAVILVYCRSGRRSDEATEMLVTLGYTNVYDFGGIVDWHYEVVLP